MSWKGLISSPLSSLISSTTDDDVGQCGPHAGREVQCGRKDRPYTVSLPLVGWDVTVVVAEKGGGGGGVETD